MFRDSIKKMSPIPLGYRKAQLPNLQNDSNVEKLQSYNPIYPLFFEMDETNYNKVCFEHAKYMVDYNHIMKKDNPKKQIECPMYIKYAPLIDPIHYLIGKYKNENNKWLQLPQLHSTTDDCMKKVLDYNNTSYIDTFFNYLSSRTLNDYHFYHGIDFYGSFLAVQKRFLFNAYEDMDYLRESDYFLEKHGEIYEVDDYQEGSPTDDWPCVPESNHKSDTHRPKLLFMEKERSSELEFTDFIEDVNTTDTNHDTDDTDQIEEETVEDMEIVYENHSDNKDEYDSDGSSVNYSTEEEEDETDDTQEEEPSDEEGEDGQSISSTESETDGSGTSMSEASNEFLPLYIYNFPIQMIAIEKCEGTLDELLDKNTIDEDEITSALIQIIFTLIAYQKMFDFTHNDLHTNNIVYKRTNEKFIYYQFDKKCYKVPSYGRLYKIIDFGRSIYRFQNKLFCSDSFAPNGDANGQYNTEPYFDEKKARIEPNKSFDLCRLGCSMFNFILEKDDSSTYIPLSEMTQLQHLVYSWCLDDHGVNILYKKNGDERYPHFKLYKMIARLVHNKQPETQLSLPIFSQFVIANSPKKGFRMNLDELPTCWVSVESL